MSSLPRPSFVWSTSGPLLLAYGLVALAMLAVLEANLRVGAASKSRKWLHPFVVLLIAAASHFLAYWGLGLLVQRAGYSVRLAMAGVPLFLILERYGARASRQAQDRKALSWGAVGALAGFCGSAWFLLRHAATLEPVKQANVSGYVSTISLNQALNNPNGWSISVQLVVFYLLAVAVFMGAHYALNALARGGEPTGGRAATLLVSSALANALIVFGLVRVCALAQVQPRLAMVGLPLFLIVESYIKRLRADRPRRLPYWGGFVGSLGGALAAGFLLMRGLPIH